MKKRKIRMGMIGGGLEGFIGDAHRKAAFLDGQIELVCGAFSSQVEKCKDIGEKLYLDENRCYASYEEMFEKEKELPLGVRMDFVSIVTPNHLHFPMSKLALENGFHVMCDKPLCFDVMQAKELVDICSKTNLLFALTHAYTGYPMVKQAKKLIEDNKLGKIRKILVEYPQGWLSTSLEKDNHKQASWRTDPKTAGISCCLADIGTHCQNLLEYITSLEIKEVCADLSSFGEGRVLDDDASVLLRLNNGAKGVLSASQISTGEENDLNIRIYGERTSLKWSQMQPNKLIIKHLNNAQEKYSTGSEYLDDIAKYNTRLPAGHPEGLLEAFANLYRNFASCIQDKLTNTPSSKEDLDFPDIYDGLKSMLFIEACVLNSKGKEKWSKIEEVKK